MNGYWPPIIFGILIGLYAHFFIHPSPIVKNYPSAIQQHGEK